MKRFWSKVQKSPGCWEWAASIAQNGYGKFSKGSETGWVLAHRASWEMANGPIPVGMQVCHHCDNRKCVRPEHLFLGSQADNMADKVRKGRNVAKAVLTPSEVREIRALLGSGHSHRVIGEQFGVARQTVTNISTNHRWAMSA